MDPEDENDRVFLETDRSVGSDHGLAAGGATIGESLLKPPVSGDCEE